ncbi:MAG TPA: gliding motility-associated C-terminal domain-containing protein, partial [Pedobacter sp.]|uniref:gliding motility-associated C-terminal domain-containing protein n=1 Tax=Pedobacter sp. TaxID=1411316 RepID=UPI002B7CD25F
VVRVPQYSNLVLSKDIKTPPFNGKAGGIIAFDVSGTMDFNGFIVDASARGFRGGYGPVGGSEGNINSVYVIPSSDPRSVGKGEGIAGTPRFMWDGFNRVDNGAEGLPGGSYGKGAPGNAGGGGNDHNSGGGGGGNGGSGGVGGNGVVFGNADDTFPNGGRPGSVSYNGAAPDISRLVMGGGGGGGDANDALDGVKGGVGGGIILVNAGSIKGRGVIKSNGSNGAIGISGVNPDGAGGGGAGGTIYIKVNTPDLTANLTLEARGGNGGNTARDQNQYHGPGGGGGGGQIFYMMPVSTVTTDISPGASGLTAGGSNHGAVSGTDGYQKFFAIADLPVYLQGSGSGCYPELSTTMSQLNGNTVLYPGSLVKYRIVVRNAAGGGNAGGVEVQVQLPSGFVFDSATASLGGDSGGPAVPTNLINNAGDTGTPNRPLLGDFNISPEDAVTITLIARTDCGISAGNYNSSAQALYLDPSRTLNGINRRITSKVNASADAKTNYETGSGGTVLGSNYDGSLSDAENVSITAFILSGNVIQIPANDVYCVNGDPGKLNGSVPEEDTPESFSYQWQISENGTDFLDVAEATGADFDPVTITTTVYYRRKIFHLGCPLNSISNRVKLSVYVQVIFDAIPNVCEEKLPFRLTQGREKWGVETGDGSYSGPGVSMNDVFSPSLAGPGQHEITYTFLADNGCSDSKTVKVTVFATPDVNAGADLVILEGGEATLSATATGKGLSYKWTPAAGLNRDDILNPVASPADDTRYSLTVKSGEGCVVTMQVFVKVLKKLSVPNAFSPNGDGINDEWSIKYLNTYPNATVIILNRYGEKVYAGGSQTKGWDGRYSGTDVPAGTYYYLIDPRNGRRVTSGALTLVR